MRHKKTELKFAISRYDRMRNQTELGQQTEAELRLECAGSPKKSPKGPPLEQTLRSNNSPSRRQLAYHKRKHRLHRAGRG